MGNPFEYFGLGNNADRSELDKAYSRVRDDILYKNTGDDAEINLKEADNAYNQAVSIIEQRKNQAVAINSITADFESKAEFISNMIKSRNFVTAESVLCRYNLQQYAKWHYLFACLRFAQGWMNEAFIHSRIAYQLEPSNPLYAQSYMNMTGMKKGEVSNKDIALIISTGVLSLIGSVCCFAMTGQELNIPIVMAFDYCLNCEFPVLCTEPCDAACDAYCDTQCEICCGDCIDSCRTVDS